MMHAVTEFEIAKREFRVVEMHVQAVELRLVDGNVLAHFGVEALERAEVVTLVRVIQGLAEIQVLQRVIGQSVIGQGLADDQRRDAQQGRL